MGKSGMCILGLKKYISVKYEKYVTLSIYNTELPNCCEIDPGTFLDS